MADDNFDDLAPAAPAPAKAKAAKKDQEGVSGKKVRLTIHKDSSKHATKDVFIGLNGVGYRIVRGVPVEVPVEVANVLKDAIEDRTELNEDTGKFETRQVPAYPYSIEPIV